MEREVFDRSQGFVRLITRQPLAVLSTSVLGNAMLLCSFILAFFSGFSALPDCEHKGSDCAYEAMDIYMRFDARALMNIGHVGLLLIFMTMYWQGGKMWCFYSVKLSFLLMSCASLGSLIVATTTGTEESASRVYRVGISLFLFVPSAVGLWSVSFGNEGFKPNQPSMSFFAGRSEYLRKYRDRLEPNEGVDDNPDGGRIAFYLHSALLVMTLLMIVEMAYSVFLVLANLIPAPVTFAAHCDALLKAYTTMFHYTFVLATGYAAVTRMDDSCDMFLHGGGIFFVFDLGTVIFNLSACGNGAESGGDFGHCIALQCRMLPFRVLAKGIALTLALYLRKYTLKAKDRIPFAKSEKTYRAPRLTLSNLKSYSYLEPPRMASEANQPENMEIKSNAEEIRLVPLDNKSRLNPGIQAGFDEKGEIFSGNPGILPTEIRGDDLEMKPEFPPELPGLPQSNPGVEGRDMEEKSASRTTASSPLQEAYAMAVKREWRVKACMLGVIIFSFTWCFQSILMVMVRAAIGLEPLSASNSYPTQGSLIPGSPGDLLEAFSAAENFGLHGAAFTAFHISLSYQSAYTYPLFRGIHFGSGSLIAMISTVQAALLFSTPASHLAFYYVFRAMVGTFFSLCFFVMSSKTFRAHYKLKEMAPLPSLLREIRQRRSSSGFCRIRRYERVSEETEEKELLSLDSKSSSLIATLCSKNKRISDYTIPQGDEILEQEKWMKIVTATLTLTFMLKALIQCLSASGYLKGSVYGAGQFAGIMVRAPGYDVAFHIPYLGTLFLWHGVSSGNLVALDIARCLSISLIVSGVARIACLALLWNAGEMLVGWRICMVLMEALSMLAAVFTLQGSQRCSDLIKHCSSDPLRTWRR